MLFQQQVNLIEQNIKAESSMVQYKKHNLR